MRLPGLKKFTPGYSELSVWEIDAESMQMNLRKGIIYKSAREIEKMYQAGQVVWRILELMREMAEADISTKELDTAAKKLGTGMGAEMAFFNYRLNGISYPFPGNICASIDEQVVHGIPSDRKLKNGQIISIDVGVQLDGYYGDAATTLPIGEISEEKQRLLDVTKGSLDAAIAAAVPGGRLTSVSAAVQNHVESQGFSVVKDYVGHGIGQALHEPPQVPNFVLGRAIHTRVVLKPGLVIAVEPMVNAGTSKVERLSNEWTVVTCDRRPSAHFEHTIAIMEDGVRVLTAP
jgi:methionyl aminopeptidase